MHPIYNFSAGPAALPKPVLEKAKEELLDWAGQGTSVMEVSHRGKAFIACAEKAEQDLRQLMSISDDYEVLFLQGGGRSQFFSVPLNLAKRGSKCDYLVSGQWSKIAVAEAQKYMQVNIVAESAMVEGKLEVPASTQWKLSEDPAYFHFCPNETVDGVEINSVPGVGSAPVVADMSSNILSKEINVDDYGIIYAGAQKNIGPSGLVVVIVRKDLIGFARDDTPAVFNYALQAKNDSMYNTPPTFSWYLAGLVFEWLLDIGGIAAIEKQNEQKAALLYQTIDKSAFYSNNIAVNNRSRMNVTFQLADEALNNQFLEQAERHGLKALKGHRIVGGMRASIYNAMPVEGVSVLTEFMKEFERTHG